MKQQASLGRVAHFVLDEPSPNAGQHRAAILTSEFPGENQNLTVFLDQKTDIPDAAGFHPFLRVDSVPYDESKSLGTWHWPERVGEAVGAGASPSPAPAPTPIAPSPVLPVQPVVAGSQAAATVTPTTPPVTDAQVAQQQAPAPAASPATVFVPPTGFNPLPAGPPVADQQLGATLVDVIAQNSTLTTAPPFSDAPVAATDATDQGDTEQPAPAPTAPPLAA